MAETIWLAVGIILIFEGIFPMLFPKRWREHLLEMSHLPERLLRRFGGCLVVIGAVILYWIFRH